MLLGSKRQKKHEILQENSGCDELVDDALSKYKKSDVNKDDILDSLVAAVTAKCGFDSLRTIPDAPEHDETGLPMEMVYYTPDGKILK